MPGKSVTKVQLLLYQFPRIPLDASEYAKDFPQSTIIDKEALAKVSHVITFRETRSYWDWLESLDREGLTSLATI